MPTPSVSSFIPKVWSPKLLEQYRRDMIFRALCSRDYEGDVAEIGDTVHIGALTDLTVRPYTKSSTLAAAEYIGGTDRTLTIDYALYTHAAVNDADAMECRVDLVEAAKANSIRRLQEGMETYIEEVLVDEAGITGTCDVSQDMAEQLLGIMTAMDQRNVPKRGRAMVLPPTMEDLLPRYEGAAGLIMAPGAAAAKLGARYNFAGFDIYSSTDLVDELIALAPGAVQYVEKINIETYRIELGIGTGVKGFLLGGVKVVLPDGVAAYSLS